MDYNLLIAAGLGILAVPVGIAVVVWLFARRDPMRKRALVALLVGVALVGVVVRYAYQIHWLDEGLWAAANSGEPQRVRELLIAGASPEGHWESGISALQVALEHRRDLRGDPSTAPYDEVIEMLRKAGAREPGSLRP